MLSVIIPSYNDEKALPLAIASANAVKNVNEINSFLKPLGYEVILAGKGHIYPSKKFKWSQFFFLLKSVLKRQNGGFKHGTKPQ